MLASFSLTLRDVSTFVFGRCRERYRTGFRQCLPTSTLFIFDTLDACVRFYAIVANSEYTANTTFGETSSPDTSSESSSVEETCQYSARASTSTKAFGKKTKEMDSISALV